MENFKTKNSMDMFDALLKKRQKILLVPDEDLAGMPNVEKLLGFYQSLVRREVPRREFIHNLFIYITFERIHATHQDADLSDLFIAVTEFDVIYRTEVWYIGNENLLSDVLSKKLLKKIEEFEHLAADLKIDMIAEFNCTNDEIDDAMMAGQDLSDELQEDYSMLRHYLIGAAAGYYKGKYKETCTEYSMRTA